MKLFSVFSFAILLPKFSHAENDDSTVISTSYIRNHSFLFISGWPQSGTSLMQQMFSVAPETSTMVAKCTTLIPGRKCIDWNHEGQWALKFLTAQPDAKNSPSTALLNPGTMCEATFKRPQTEGTRTISDKEQRIIFNQQIENGIDITRSPQWSRYWSAIFNMSSTFSRLWDLDMPLLVEKSPHSMLKLNLLRDVFVEAKSVKFLVTIKHPATLNVGLPRDYEWLTKKIRVLVNSTTNSSAPPKIRSYTIPLNSTEIEENARFFIKFLSQKMKGTGRHCSMGWFTAMERLYMQLNLAKESPTPFEARIVRYENFAKPLLECNSILEFVHSGNPERIKESQKTVCLKYFSIAPKNKTKNSKNKNSSSNSSNKGNLPKENTSSNKVTNIKRKLNENKKNKLYEITKYDENSEKFAARRDINSYNRNSEDLEFTEERRKLRLRWAKPGREPTLITLEFLPDLHKYSIETRLSQFHEAYKKLPYLLRKELDEASDEMKKYGYSLRKGEEKWFQNNTSLFDPWIKQI